MFLLVIGRGERDIYYTPSHIYNIMILAYNKQQYRIRERPIMEGATITFMSMHSPERRRSRRRLLLLKRKKAEAFIHSLVYFYWPLCLPQLGTSDYFCQIWRNSNVRFERAYCWRRKRPKQYLCCIRLTETLLMYAAVAIIPATSSLSQTRPTFRRPIIHR